ALTTISQRPTRLAHVASCVPLLAVERVYYRAQWDGLLGNHASPVTPLEPFHRNTGNKWIFHRVKDRTCIASLVVPDLSLRSCSDHSSSPNGPIHLTTDTAPL